MEKQHYLQNNLVNAQLKFHLKFDEIIHRNDENELLVHIMSIPDFLNTHTFPDVVTSTFGRLADIFVDCTNLLRLNISKIIQKCRSHIKMITKFDDMASKFFRIIYNTDPIDRCSVLLVFASFAHLIAKSNNELQESDYKENSSMDTFTIHSLNHQILISLDSTDENEFKSAIIVAYKYAKHSPTFALKLYECLPALLDSNIDPERSQALVKCYSYMYHSPSLANKALLACLSESKRSPIGVYITYAKLVTYCPWMLNQHFTYCVQILHEKNGRQMHVCTLLALNTVAKIYSNYFNGTIVLFLFENCLKSSNNGLQQYYLFIIHSLIKLKNQYSLKYFAQFLPYFNRILSTNHFHLSILITSILNYTLKHKYELSQDKAKSYLIVGTYFIKFLFISLLKNDNKLSLFCSERIIDYLSHSPDDCILQLKFSHICISNLFNVDNSLVSSKIFVHFLYLIHIVREIEIDSEDFELLIQKVRQKYANDQAFDLLTHFRFICTYINVFSLKIPEFEWLLEPEVKSLLFLYKLAATATCCNLYEIASNIFLSLSTDESIYCLSIKDYFNTLANISRVFVAPELSRTSQPQLLSTKYIVSYTNKINGQNTKHRQHFQNDYLKIFENTSKCLRLFNSLIGFPPEESLSLTPFKFEIAELIKELMKCIKSWQNLTCSMMDADIFSFNLISFYLEILKYFIFLLKSKDTDILYEFKVLPIHPHCKKMKKILEQYISKCTNNKMLLIGCVLNFILLKSWPFPLYFYKSQSYTSIELNVKPKEDQSLGCISELNVRPNEYFVISVEGIICTYEKLIKNLDKVSKVVINAEWYAKKDKIKAGHVVSTKTLNVTDGYFNDEFLLHFEHSNIYCIKVYLSVIIDKYDFQWNCLQPTSSVITVSVPTPPINNSKK